jgi:hypothetical protein
LAPRFVEPRQYREIVAERLEILLKLPRSSRRHHPGEIMFSRQHLVTSFHKTFPLFVFVAVLVSTLGFNGCFGTDKGDDPPKTGYTCLENDPLCRPRQVLLDSGQILFTEIGCAGCHGELGQGSGAPPLANSDYFMAIRLRPVEIVLRGLSDSILVNGKWYDGYMPTWDFLSDMEVAAILTYLRAGLNDSTVVSCDDAGCEKVPRSAAEIANDSIAVWEVKAIRDALPPLP